ncbi:MAG: hypothetical protein OEW08_06470 [Gammaproteobacteria bacterium]|nr:hypothetical protein [Gammaproteobacteria bacterium]
MFSWSGVVKKLFGVFFILGSTFSAAFAAIPVVARVTDAGTNADGSVFVVFDRGVVNCDNKGLKRFDVANDHPAKNQVLLIGMTALSTFASTKIYIESCQKGVPVFTDGKAYFQLTAEKAAPLNK